jgi:hypothetical protein
MRFEMTIEVFDGQTPASLWANAHLNTILEIAAGFGAKDWRSIERSWGVIIEVAFENEEAWEAFRRAPTVVAAFDAAPRVLTRRGWGGSSGTRKPLKPKPYAGAGAAEIPIPEEASAVDAVSKLRERVEELVGPNLRPIPG